MVQMNNTMFSSVIGGTYDASSLPQHGSDVYGYMALSITGGSMNSIRSVRAMANNTDSCIGINQASHSEVSDSVVGGDGGEKDGGIGMLSGRCVWALATSQALVHDNHIKYCGMHALDFDAYTSHSVAYNNLCEFNRQEGIFLEETADHCVITNNTCQNNGNGIGVYTLEVGPVANNFIINNIVKNNRRNGLTAGGYGKDNTKMSLQNTFASNLVAGNAWDQSDTEWGPAPTAQVNPAHGAVSGNFWVSNVIKGGERYDETYVPKDASSLAVFEPEMEKKTKGGQTTTTV